MLPSEAALAAEYGIARSTLHRALERLRAERLIVSRPGKGHVVATPGQETAAGPAYRRIAAELRMAIASGSLESGAALPSEAALAAQYGVNRSTAREAFAVLAGEGLIEAVHGKGRFVRRV
jgi:GntR family mannosyl-D-glycerate transport/metabolism transcriptional repressor